MSVLMNGWYICSTSQLLELQACLTDYGNTAGEYRFAKAHAIECTLKDDRDIGSLSQNPWLMFACFVAIVCERAYNSSMLPKSGCTQVLITDPCKDACNVVMLQTINRQRGAVVAVNCDPLLLRCCCFMHAQATQIRLLPVLSGSSMCG